MAPQTARQPPTTHAARTGMGPPRSAMAKPEVVNTPAPIMLAMTSNTNVISPRVVLLSVTSRPARDDPHCRSAVICTSGVLPLGKFGQLEIFRPQVIDKPVFQYLFHEIQQLFLVPGRHEMVVGILQQLHECRMLVAVGYKARVMLLPHQLFFMVKVDP